MLVICLLLLKIEIFYKYSNCISLIIPSTYKDYLRCRNTLISSICNSIFYPDEIVIVISNIENRSIDFLFNITASLKKCAKRIILKYRRKQFNAASNRNYGFKFSTCPIISFFDVDDIMSIYRMYVINKMFNDNKHIDVVLHPSTRNYRKLDVENKTHIYYKNIIVDQYNQIKEKCIKTYEFDGRIFKCDVSNGFFITNGWPSLKKKIMKLIKFNETLQSTEDLDFLSKVVRNGYNVGIFKKPLGYYIKDNQCKIY